MDLSQYLDLFVSESRNHIKTFDELIVNLEKEGNDPASINELFRHMHSLKGMAATMQFDSVSKLAHLLEDLLGLIRDNPHLFRAETADILLEGNDLLSAMITSIENGDNSLMPDTSSLVSRLAAAMSGPVQTELPQSNPEPSADARDEHHHQSRQVDVIKSVRIKTETLDRLVNITGELFTTRHQLADCSKGSPSAGLQAPMKQLSILLRELRDVVLQARMLPFAHVAERFPRLVRDLARSQNKDVAFDVIGKNIELDRGVLEEITEPLIHILRNAIDHGMESNEERILNNKPAQGSISISVLRDKAHVTIAIADDGRGMDPKHLADHAVRKGLITTEQAAALSPQEAFQLICTPGFSTATEISSISGRGVGMDAVNSSIHNLGGSLTIDSRKGLGSIFLLKLPISVSIIHALLAVIKGQTVAFPVNTIDRTLELHQDDIFYKEGRQLFLYQDQTLPLYNFNRHENRSLETSLSEYIPIIVSGLDSKPFGVAVDQIIGQQEIFIKPLGRPLAQLRSCTGGAVAGDGSIIFVLDINTLR